MIVLSHVEYCNCSQRAFEEGFFFFLNARRSEQAPWGTPPVFVFCWWTLKCFLTRYSNEPLAFSLHKAQLKHYLVKGAVIERSQAESKHKKSINECRGNTEVQHALIKIQLRVYSWYRYLCSHVCTDPRLRKIVWGGGGATRHKCFTGSLYAQQCEVLGWRRSW